MFGFMEAIHIKLSNKAIHFIVSEIFGEDKLLEFGYIFDSELSSVRGPIDDFDEIIDLV